MEEEADPTREKKKEAQTRKIQVEKAVRTEISSSNDFGALPQVLGDLFHAVGLEQFANRLLESFCTKSFCCFASPGCLANLIARQQKG